MSIGRILRFALGAWLAGALAMAAAQTPSPALPKLRDIAELESATQNLDRKISQLQVVGSVIGPDSGGRSLQDALDTPQPLSALRSNLAQLRSKADAQSKAGDQAGLRQTLDEASTMVMTAYFRVGMVGRSWAMKTILKYHQSLVQPLLAWASEDDREATNQRLAVARAAADTQLTQTLQAQTIEDMIRAAPVLNRALEAAVRVHNAERQRLAEQQDVQVMLPAERRALPTDGLPCSGPATGAVTTSGVTVPRPVSTRALAEFYPTISRRMQIEGVVAVRYVVSTAGCLKRVELRRSSGSAELDAAALQWLSKASFLPAEKDHQPVEAGGVLNVRFMLTETPRGASGK